MVLVKKPSLTVVSTVNLISKSNEKSALKMIKLYSSGRHYFVQPILKFIQACSGMINGYISLSMLSKMVIGCCVNNQPVWVFTVCSRASLR